MKNLSKIDKNRLKNIILSDKMLNKDDMITSLKSELKFVLSNYFELSGSILVSLSIDENNLFDIKIFSKAKRIKS